LKVHDLLWRSQVECCYATFSPAVIRPAKPDCNNVAGVNGDQAYYTNGKLHRPPLEGSGSPLEIPS